MSESLVFTTEQFECIANLQDNMLDIGLRHISDCYIWSTTIEGMLCEDKETDNSHTKTFDINPEPHEILELLENFSSEDNYDCDVTFPETYTNEKDDLYIILQWHIMVGNQVRTATRTIVLKPEFIPNDILATQRLKYANELLANKFNNFENELKQKDQQIKKLETHVLTLTTKYDELTTELSNYQRIAYTETKEFNDFVKHISVKMNTETHFAFPMAKFYRKIALTRNSNANSNKLMEFARKIFDTQQKCIQDNLLTVVKTRRFNIINALSKVNIQENNDNNDNNDENKPNNFVDNLNLEEMSPEELINVLHNDEQYEEVFNQLNELFLEYSNNMTTLDGKRKIIIDLMKAIHSEFKYKQEIVKNYIKEDEDEETDEETDEDEESIDVENVD